jgi:lipopolysaccharide/colanic/teichoic acid biosynthesis glycosyltransferase
MQGPGLTHRMAKRAIDVLGAVAGLVLLAVPMAMIALAIKLSDPGSPVLFRQWRCGQGGRGFRLAKFRTMIPGADALKEELRDRSTSGWPDFRLVDDPRVTPVGRILRRSSLDELPQLWSVLRGDMSLVGPRPTSFDAHTYALWQTERLDHRPGLTGPWQVRGRTDMDFDERCRLEISFFRMPSLGRELWLILVTIGVVLRRTGAA